MISKSKSYMFCRKFAAIHLVKHLQPTISFNVGFISSRVNKKFFYYLCFLPPTLKRTFEVNPSAKGSFQGLKHLN